MKTDLEAQVADVAKAWENSPYYDDAERWTHRFWNPDTIFNQMFRRLDLTSVVELACGYGRHSAQIAAQASRIVMVDIFDNNLEQCRSRLGMHDHIEFMKGNGKDFSPLPDESTTAIFCYDAMVHFAPDMVQSYVQDAARILKRGGMALFHHSNYGDAPNRHYGQNPHARNHMTTELFASYVGRSGLFLAEQKIIDWGNAPKIDAISLLGKP